ncbi:hypothetical protein [Psychroserpens sp. NJDZ02]|uniref:hypothetical protein n=1 Tax=Psychroserpens sp. NJDZ02 TaxID=2570561 RepID=UPI0010A92782|nr:hypothetical protein [Psychroserpens sp. NJDZ02]QCE43176.1 hypothetical protein E9099_17720 [Psychroserpens sp. NJDZ02]
MSSDFQDLQNKWDHSKSSLDQTATNFDSLYAKIKHKERDNYMFYYGTITILLITLVVIALFFYHVAPVKTLVSKIGVGLMLGGLIFRIYIEVISIYKAKQINTLDNALQAVDNTIKFHQFRKTIHQVIAPIIIILYTIGFYLITPEFSLHMPFWNLILIDVSYVVIGIILFIVIRKAVKKEMHKLAEILKLKKDLTE